MFCGNCNQDFSKCECEGVEEKLDGIPNFVYNKCKKCGKHYARCRCEEPDLAPNKSF